MVHLHNGILRSGKKELVPFVRAWMELENIMLSEISQSVKDKYHMILTYKWNLMNKIETEAWIPGTD